MYKLMILILTFAVFSGCCSLSSNDYGTQTNPGTPTYPNDDLYNSQPANGTVPVDQQPANQLPQVVINGKTLSMQEIQQLVQIYGTFYEGRFWYDSVSGLAGREGYPAEFRLYPGHNFLGSVKQDASNGNTGVIVNGRELTEAEVQYLENILQVPRQSGEYYLDSNGNFGNNQYGSVNLYSIGSSSGGYYDSNGQYQGTGEIWSTSGGYGGNSQGGCSYVNVGGDFATSGCG